MERRFDQQLDDLKQELLKMGAASRSPLSWTFPRICRFRATAN